MCTWIRTTPGHTSSVARGLLVASVVCGCLLQAACADSDSEPETELTATANSPLPTYTGPGELRTIENTTQLHLDGVGIGVGNIWEEAYTPTSGEGGEVRTGLTALLSISVEGDPARNQTLRVHPGQELTVPGYQVQVVAIEEQRVHLAVIEDAP